MAEWKEKIGTLWSSTTGKLVVTALLLSMSVALRWLPAPGLRLSDAAYWGLSTHPMSLGALGLAPFILGYLLVEAAAAFRPAWRPLRTGGIDGRRTLHTASGVVGLGMALLMAVTAGVYWFDWLTAMPGPVGFALEGGLWERLVFGASLVGGTSALFLLASLISRYGLGNGFSVIILGGLLFEMIPASRKFIEWIQRMNAQNLDVFGVMGNSLAVALVILGTLWVIFKLPRRGMQPADGESGEQPGDIGETAWWPLPGPTAGILPVALAVWCVDVGRQVVARFTHTGAEFWIHSVREATYGTSTVFVLLKIAAVVAGAYGFSRWFYRVDDWSEAWAKVGGGSRDALREYLQQRRRLAMLYSGGFVLGVLLLGEFGGELLRSIGAVNVVLVTAIAVDVLREWSFRHAHADQLVAVEERHRLWNVPPTLTRLHKRGIDAFARGRAHRSMLHVFAPYVPVQILVPADRAAEARQALADEEQG